MSKFATPVRPPIKRITSVPTPKSNVKVNNKVKSKEPAAKSTRFEDMKKQPEVEMAASVPIESKLVAAPAQNHDDATVELLIHKLDHAEAEGKIIASHLSLPEHSSTIAPFCAPRDPTRARNYDALVARVCRAESALQGLKMAAMRVQAERDLNSKTQQSPPKDNSMSEKFEKQVGLLTRELKQKSDSAAEAQSENQKLLLRVQELTDEADQASTTQIELSAENESLAASKAKLLRRTEDLRAELAREQSLRASLEDSHAALLSRVTEMEDAVEAERKETRNLSTSCNTLKRDLVSAQDLAQAHGALREQQDAQLLAFKTKADDQDVVIASLEKEKHVLLAEVTRMKKDYTTLSQQIDQLRGGLDAREEGARHLAAEAQTAQLIAQYEKQLESTRAQLAQRTHQELVIADLRDQLTRESEERAQSLQYTAQLEQQVTELRFAQESSAQTTRQMETRAQEDAQKMRAQIKALEGAREQALREKNALLDEVNATVDGVTEDKARSDAQLAQVQMTLREAEARSQQLRDENARLLERMAALEDAQNAHKQVETTLHEMQETKNKLSYDKGRLQNKVDSLQRELENLAGAKAELTSQRQTNRSMESRYNKSQLELNEARSKIQRLEAQIKQLGVSSERKETDFDLAIKARDEAVNESHKLLIRIETAEERERQKINGLNSNIAEARADNRKLAGTLQSVMTSHGQLQTAVEGLQAELGSRDAAINDLQEERNRAQLELRACQDELNRVQDKLVSVQEMEQQEIGPLQNALARSKDDNEKLAANVEKLLTANSQLQESLRALQNDLEKKDQQLKQKCAAHAQVREEMKSAGRTADARLREVREELTREREKNSRRAAKDVTELKGQLADCRGRSGEISRANTELRQKVGDLEQELRMREEKVAQQKGAIARLQKTRERQEAALLEVHGVRKEIACLVAANEEYLRKNKQQSRAISSFVKQIDALKDEIQQVSQQQLDNAVLVERQAERERAATRDLKRKYKEVRKRAAHLEDLRARTERRIREAHDESRDLARGDTHEWFQGRFGGLQQELKQARDVTASDQLDRLLEEREKRVNTEVEATSMIKANRETIARLTAFAQVAQQEATQQLTDMRSQLAQETQAREEAQQQLQVLQDSSLRCTEELARELEFYKSHSYLSDCSTP